MGFRYRKSVNLGGGARLNLSKKGVGMSVGGKGFRHSVGPSGRRTTVSIPGTGISHETRHSSKNAGAGCASWFIWGIVIAVIVIAVVAGS